MHFILRQNLILIIINSNNILASSISHISVTLLMLKQKIMAQNEISEMWPEIPLICAHIYKCIHTTIPFLK